MGRLCDFRHSYSLSLDCCIHILGLFNLQIIDKTFVCIKIYLVNFISTNIRSM